MIPSAARERMPEQRAATQDFDRVPKLLRQQHVRVVNDLNCVLRQGPIERSQEQLVLSRWDVVDDRPGRHYLRVAVVLHNVGHGGAQTVSMLVPVIERVKNDGSSSWRV
jgi:hypothetical protein